MTTEEKLLKLLPDGVLVPRAKLVKEMDISDRTVRRVIANLRKDGVIIVNQSDGLGYKRLKLLKKNYKQIQEWVNQERARVKRICMATAASRRYLRDIQSLFGMYKKAGSKNGY